MFRYDYHLHTGFSSDSREDPENYLRSAVQLGYSEIAFTEHLDFLEKTPSFTDTYENYISVIDSLRVKYSQIKILLGFEVGEYHLTKKEADDFFSIRKPDLKVCSIHMLTGGYNISIPFNYEVNNQLIESYYLENLEMIRKTDFDVLGHLGIYKRYLKEQTDESKVSEIITDILKILILKGIALEINISGLRKTVNDTIPDRQILKKFKEMGGEIITIGSDSHRISDFNQFYEKTVGILKEIGLKYVFRKNNSEWMGEKL